MTGRTRSSFRDFTSPVMTDFTPLQAARSSKASVRRGVKPEVGRVTDTAAAATLTHSQPSLLVMSQLSKEEVRKLLSKLAQCGY